MYPLCVERHIDEDAGLVGSGTAPAMDADSHDDPDFPILTHQRAAVVSLLKQNQKQKQDATFFSINAFGNSLNPCLYPWKCWVEEKCIIVNSWNRRNQDRNSFLLYLQ